MESANQPNRPGRPPHRAAGNPPRPPGGRAAEQVVGNQYILRRKLGEGAAGEVWLAHDKVLDRDVALKRMRAGTVDARVKDFVREARATARLNHPNIVTIYQVGRDTGHVFIAMEYVEAGSLSDELAGKGALPWRTATEAIRDAAAGLQAAHAAGIVHRDIKPSNLMRSARGIIKVVDFGLARGGDAQATMTQAGTILGSPAYMSPEQCRGQAADARSDIYSLTCAYYQLLTGELPFTGETVESVMFQHCSQALPDAASKVQRLPDGVRRILGKGAQKKPEARYQSASELLAALNAVLSTPEASHIFGSRLMPIRDASVSARRMATSVVKGKGIVGKVMWATAVVGLCVLLVLWMRHRSENDPLKAAAAETLPPTSLNTATVAEKTIRETALPHPALQGLKIDKPEDLVDMKPAPAPASAIVLFNGKDLSNWTSRNGTGPARWEVADGVLTAVVGTGDIITTHRFEGAYKLHIEFRLPYEPNHSSQGRANSGVYINTHWEVQVLDSYHNSTGAKTGCGAIYQIEEPTENVPKAPTVWQQYDIEFHPAMCKGGQVVERPTATILWNGVKVHDKTRLTLDCTNGAKNGDICQPAPLMLQEHGSPVQFKNIWAVPIK